MGVTYVYDSTLKIKDTKIRWPAAILELIFEFISGSLMVVVESPWSIDGTWQRCIFGESDRVADNNFYNEMFDEPWYEDQNYSTIDTEIDRWVSHPRQPSDFSGQRGDWDLMQNYMEGARNLHQIWSLCVKNLFH